MRVRATFHLFARMSLQVLQQNSPRVKMLHLEQIANALHDAVRVHNDKGFRIRVVIYFDCTATAAIHALVLAAALIVAHE
jgi:hypothetical protein